MALVQKAIEDFKEGDRSNVAIISDPFYGESNLMNLVEELTGPRNLRINGRFLILNFELLEKTSKEIVMVDEAHHIYQRKIGGFEVTNRFLGIITTSEQLFITTWNAYSWKYLDEVLGIGKHFARQIRLPKKDSNQIRELLLSGYGEEELTFIEEEQEGEEEQLVRRSHYEKSLFGRNLKIPYPIIRWRQIKPRLDRKESKSAEEILFDKLTRISDGNPGVAEHLWKDALDYPYVRNTLKEPLPINLNYDESYALSIVLFMGSIEIKELSAILDPSEMPPEEIISYMEGQGLISLDGDVCSIRPEALKRVAEHLRKMRLVW